MKNIKKTIVLLTPILLFVGCASTNNYQGDYIDSTTSPGAVSENWIIDYRAAPFYPASAARNKIIGCVRFHFIIAEGQANNIEVTDSYPRGVFEREATAALKKWRWKPVQGEYSQPVSTTLRLDFDIDAADRTLPQEVCANEASTGS